MDKEQALQVLEEKIQYENQHDFLYKTNLAKRERQALDIVLTDYKAVKDKLANIESFLKTVIKHSTNSSYLDCAEDCLKEIE